MRESLSRVPTVALGPNDAFGELRCIRPGRQAGSPRSKRYSIQCLAGSLVTASPRSRSGGGILTNFSVLMSATAAAAVLVACSAPSTEKVATAPPAPPLPSASPVQPVDAALVDRDIAQICADAGQPNGASGVQRVNYDFTGDGQLDVVAAFSCQFDDIPDVHALFWSSEERPGSSPIDIFDTSALTWIDKVNRDGSSIEFKVEDSTNAWKVAYTLEAGKWKPKGGFLPSASPPANTNYTVVYELSAGGGKYVHWQWRTATGISQASGFSVDWDPAYDGTGVAVPMATGDTAESIVVAGRYASWVECRILANGRVVSVNRADGGEGATAICEASMP